MAAPNVTVTIEPNDAGSVLVLELAPLSSSQPGAAQLSLRVEVTNHEATSVKLSSVSLQFPGSSVPAATIAASLQIGSGGWGEWHFEAANNIILPWPGPAVLAAQFTFDGYSTPVSIHGPTQGARQSRGRWRRRVPVSERLAQRGRVFHRAQRCPWRRRRRRSVVRVRHRGHRDR